MKIFSRASFVGILLTTVAPVVTLAATPADTLVIAQNIDDIVSIDPAEAYEFSSGEYVTQTYDRLVQYEAEDTKKAGRRARRLLGCRRCGEDDRFHAARRRQVHFGQSPGRG